MSQKKSVYNYQHESALAVNFAGVLELLLLKAFNLLASHAFLHVDNLPMILISAHLHWAFCPLFFAFLS